MNKTNIFKIILIVYFLQFFATGCVKYCRDLLVSSSDENHVTLVMQVGYNKCTETDIIPKANSACEVFGKEAIYTGQRRIHRQLLYVDFNCKGNEPVYKNQQKKRIKPNEIPEDLIIIEPSEVL